MLMTNNIGTFQSIELATDRHCIEWDLIDNEFDQLLLIV